ncbi:MAG: tyrosine-type recombinase/integrase [bacterium]|nr:tyrosine-type recombinase/integrase [bacterium]
MMGLDQALKDYLAVRRSLGYKLKLQGKSLSDFVACVEHSDNPFITTSIALAWATQPAGATPNTWSARLGVVRRFAEYVRTIDPRTEIPSPELLPSCKARSTPYLYSDADVRALMRAARVLRGPLRPSTYATLFGLLATTGMRVGEAIALDRADLDLREGLLVIRDGKFGKSREVALHPTTQAAMRAYARERDRVYLQPKSASFFVSLAGTRLIRQCVHATFLRLVHQAGLSNRRPRRPRIHDLRHSFAVQTLLRWYREGLDVQAKLPLLSTYLGHVNPSSTYWYLTAAPELVGLAAQRLERFMGELP